MFFNFIFELISLQILVRFISEWVRNVVMSVESRAQLQIEEKNLQLAQKVESAKLEQLEVQFTQDMDELDKRSPTAEKEALEAAKDQLFLRERQRTFD